MRKFGADYHLLGEGIAAADELAGSSTRTAAKAFKSDRLCTQ
jgi:hypothetical protein